MDDKHKIQICYKLDKKYCIFIEGTYTSDKNKNADNYPNSSSDINEVFHEISCNDLNTLVGVENNYDNSEVLCDNDSNE